MTHGVVVIITGQLHSTKSELRRFCAGSNPACSVLEIAMVRTSDNGPAENKTKRLSSSNHNTKAIYHHCLYVFKKNSKPAFTCSSLTIETPEQRVKYVQS